MDGMSGMVVPGTVASMVNMSRSIPRGTSRSRHNQKNQESLLGSTAPVNPSIREELPSFGVVIKDNAGAVLLKQHGFVGKGKAMSNNVAEYAGVLHVLKCLARRPPGRAKIYGDSNLVINQLNGKWRVNKGLYFPIAIETRDLLAHHCDRGWQISFCWIRREQNEECDALSKKAANKPNSIPSLEVLA